MLCAGLAEHDFVHRRQADHQPVLDSPKASEVVAATAHRNLEATISTKTQRVRNIF